MFLMVSRGCAILLDTTVDDRDHNDNFTYVSVSMITTDSHRPASIRPQSKYEDTQSLFDYAVSSTAPPHKSLQASLTVSYDMPSYFYSKRAKSRTTSCV